jgi:hypothetical protein
MLEWRTWRHHKDEMLMQEISVNLRMKVMLDRREEIPAEDATNE